jgi:hypothetical protein
MSVRQYGPDFDPGPSVGLGDAEAVAEGVSLCGVGVMASPLALSAAACEPCTQAARHNKDARFRILQNVVNPEARPSASLVSTHTAVHPSRR